MPKLSPSSLKPRHDLRQRGTPVGESTDSPFSGWNDVALSPLGRAAIARDGRLARCALGREVQGRPFRTRSSPRTWLAPIVRQRSLWRPLAYHSRQRFLVPSMTLLGQVRLWRPDQKPSDVIAATSPLQRMDRREGRDFRLNRFYALETPLARGMRGFD